MAWPGYSCQLQFRYGRLSLGDILANPLKAVVEAPRRHPGRCFVAASGTDSSQPSWRNSRPRILPGFIAAGFVDSRIADARLSVVYRFDVVAVRVEQKCTVVAGVIDGTFTGVAVIASAGV